MHLRAEGIVVVKRSEAWSVRPMASRDITFENFHLLSEVRDGLNTVNSQSVAVRESFIMAHDDAICLKGLSSSRCAVGRDSPDNSAIRWCFSPFPSNIHEC